MQRGNDRKGEFFAYRTTPVPTKSTVKEMSNLSKKEVRSYLSERYEKVTEIKYSDNFVCRIRLEESE